MPHRRGHKTRKHRMRGGRREGDVPMENGIESSSSTETLPDQMGGRRRRSRRSSGRSRRRSVRRSKKGGFLDLLKDAIVPLGLFAGLHRSKKHRRPIKGGDDIA